MNSSEIDLGVAYLIADGKILKMGRHMNITFEPQPALGLTFEDVVRHFLDVPYARDIHLAHGDESDPRGTTVERASHVFRVAAGEVRVELRPGRASIPDTRRVVSVTVSDNLYREWKTTQTMRAARAARLNPASSAAPTSPSKR